MLHYTYLTPVYNGLYTTGRCVAMCDAVDVPMTSDAAAVTCPACRAYVSGGAA